MDPVTGSQLEDNAEYYEIRMRTRAENNTRGVSWFDLRELNKFNSILCQQILLPKGNALPGGGRFSIIHFKVSGP